MARCICCELDLDEIERYCPGCGAPRPRTKVVDVSTSLRERFHAAAGDTDTEYAFGGKRMVRTASPKAPVKDEPPRAAPPKAKSAPSKPNPEPKRDREPKHQPKPPAEAVVAPPVAEASLPSPEPEPEPVVEEAEPAEVDGGPDPEPVVVLDVEPEEQGLLPEPDSETEPEPVIAAVEPGSEQLLAEAVPDGAEEDAPIAVDENEAPEPVDEPAARVAVVAEPTDLRPYVVLPPRRQVVAVQVLPPVIAEEAEEPLEAPKRRGGMVVVLLVLLAIVGGGAFFLTGREAANNATPFTADATDASISLDGPAGWRVESRGAGVVGIGEPSHDLHVHATAIRRSALKDGLTLKRRAEDVQDEFVASLEGAEASDAVPAKIGPYAAIRQTLSTNSVVYVHTVVKMPKYFVNVLGWTPAERFADEQGKLLSVVATLQSSSS